MELLHYKDLVILYVRVIQCFFRVKCASGKGKEIVLKSASITPTCYQQSHTHYATVVWFCVKKPNWRDGGSSVAEGPKSNLDPTDHQKRSQIYFERGDRNHQKIVVFMTYSSHLLVL